MMAKFVCSVQMTESVIYLTCGTFLIDGAAFVERSLDIVLLFKVIYSVSYEWLKSEYYYYYFFFGPWYSIPRE